MLYAKSQAEAKRGPGLIEGDLVWSFDNARPYNFWADGKSAHSQPWDRFERAPLPTKSPDIHKVIEHTFARHKQFFRELVYMELAGVWQEQQLTDTRLMRLCGDALRRAAAPASIQHHHYTRIP